ncbi:hypothetical protein K449DRAFT_36729 [Hypoxylon sp. EC38]|nr:hypothetical protein K449DRAFT_36729 [Hypoxylon sp. EC38]
MDVMQQAVASWYCTSGMYVMTKVPHTYFQPTRAPPLYPLHPGYEQDRHHHHHQPYM